MPVNWKGNARYIGCFILNHSLVKWLHNVCDALSSFFKEIRAKLKESFVQSENRGKWGLNRERLNQPHLKAICKFPVVTMALNLLYKVHQ